MPAPKEMLKMSLPLLAGLFLVFALLAGGVLFHLKWMTGLVWLVPAVLLARSLSLKAGRSPEEADAGDALPGVLLSVCLVAYLFSSAPTDPWFYFQEWPPAFGIGAALLKSWPARMLILTALLTPLLLLRRNAVPLLLAALALGAVAVCAAKFLAATGGAALYCDDHPSFLFRLWSLARTMPRAVSYNPYWNGGGVFTQAVSTGAVPIGVLFWPLWRFAPITATYTPAMAVLFAVLVPLLSGLAVRLAGGSRSAAFAGAVLGLGVSQAQFLWLLHFGTIGAALSSALLPLVSACLYRVLWLDRREPWLAALLVIAAWACLGWPPAALFCAPLALGLLAGVRQMTRPKLRFLALCAAAVSVLCLPLVLGLLRHSDPIAFAAQGNSAVRLSALLRQGWANLCGQCRQASPLLLFLGLGGVCFLPSRGIRAVYVPLLLGLAAFAGWGEGIKPQLQLTRFAIPLFYAAIIPAALWIDRLLATRRWQLAPLRAGLLALLALTGWQAGRYFGNGGIGRYAVMPDEIPSLVAWLKDHTPDQGRILFAGSTVHAYGRGHVAFLPVLAGREMMACDYFHFSPRRVEYNYPPAEFRQTDRDVEDFMRLYNVTHVITYHDFWLRLLRRHPESYAEVHTFGNRTKKSVFRVRREPSFFARGAGTVRSEPNALWVRVDDPDRECVLAYNWADGLAATPPTVVRPVDMGRGVRFIAVAPGGQKEFRIAYRRWL